MKNHNKVRHYLVFNVIVLVLVLTHTKIFKVCTPYFLYQGQHTFQVESYKFPTLIHHLEKTFLTSIWCITSLWIVARANKTQIEEILVIGAKVSK